MVYFISPPLLDKMLLSYISERNTFYGSIRVAIVLPELFAKMYFVCAGYETCNRLNLWFSWLNFTMSPIIQIGTIHWNSYIDKSWDLEFSKLFSVSSVTPYKAVAGYRYRWRGSPALSRLPTRWPDWLGLGNLTGPRATSWENRFFVNPGERTVSQPPPQTGSGQISRFAEIGYHDM